MSEHLPGDVEPTDPVEPRPRGLRRFLEARTLTQKASLTAAASMIDYTARLVIGFLLNPVLVSNLGDQLFGIYQVLGRFIGYATPAGGRPSQALKWTLAHHQHSSDVDVKRRQVGSAVLVWFLFLPVLVVATGILAWFAPVWLGVPSSLVWTVRLAAAVLAVDLIVTNLSTIPQSVLQGENLGYKRIGLSTAILVAGGIATAATVVLGGGIVGVAICVLATTVVTGIMFLWVAERNVPWFGMIRPPLREVMPFVRLSGWFVLWNLVMQLMRSSDVVVLGIVGSPELVTTFVLARYVPEAIFSIVAIAISAVMPGLGGMIGAGRTDAAISVRGESMSLTWLIATTSGAVYLLWGKSFTALWVGAQYYPGALTSFLIVVMVLQFAFIRNDASIIDLTLNLRNKVLLGLVSSGIAIAAAVGLMRAGSRGIDAMVIGFMLGRLILSVTYPWLVAAYLGAPPVRQFLSAIRPTVVALALLGAAAALATRVQVGGWLLLVLVCGVSLVAVVPVAFFAGLTRGARRAFIARARRVLAHAG